MYLLLMYTILDCQNVPTSGFVVLLTYIFDDVPTSGLAKCTYFWILKMYILLDFQNVPTSVVPNSGLQYVPTSDVHNSGFSKCTYFWCTQFCAPVRTEAIQSCLLLFKFSYINFASWDMCIGNWKVPARIQESICYLYLRSFALIRKYVAHC